LIGILEWFFFVFLSVFIGVYGGYFTYVALKARQPWSIKIDNTYQPEISILIPVHDEERNIQLKLTNVNSVLYPKQKMEIIIADDASKDRTMNYVKDFVEDNPELNVKIVKQTTHEGKSAALNRALSIATKDLVIVTDADTTWPEDLLQKSMAYLSDPIIGAITCRGENSNNSQSWVTKAEDTYLNYANLMRLGESKVYSTIKFEGGFCAYKKGTFKGFDCETGSDDSGTALEIVQNNYKTILVPEVAFYTRFPANLQGKLKIKMRRATQLMSIWLKCLGLMMRKHLRLPKRIAVPEILMFVFIPWVFLALVATAIAIVILSPLSLLSIAIVTLFCGSLILARRSFLEVMVDNFILVYALVNLSRGQRYAAWEKTST
jgi:cellulose synthase/poly-beta-1,6-N-acetylglucosamine synthase-like glycosyltransferase